MNMEAVVDPWFVVYTKPRHEKKLSDYLNGMGVEAYCPIVTQMKQWSDRVKKVDVPLIPSYVFVRIEESKRNLVFHSPSAVNYLFWLGKPAVVRDKEIRTLKELIEGKAVKNFNVDAYQLGDKFEIKSGAFSGQTGVIKDVKHRNVTILLQQLGIAVTLSF